MRIAAVLAQFTDLEAQELTLWVEAGWIKPSQDEELNFETIDIARVRLVYDLRRSCGVEPSLMPLVLSLLDQVYDLRSALKAMSAAILAQPEGVRRDMTRSIEEYNRALLSRP